MIDRFKPSLKGVREGATLTDLRTRQICHGTVEAIR